MVVGGLNKKKKLDFRFKILKFKILNRKTDFYFSLNLLRLKPRKNKFKPLTIGRSLPGEDVAGARDRLALYGPPAPPPPDVYKKIVPTQHTAVRQERHEEHKTAAARGPFTPHQQDPHLAGELFA